MASGLDLMKLIKEASKMQELVNAQQDELGKKLFEAEVGGGMVKARVNGKLDVLAIEAEPTALETLGLESLLELAAAAVNEAQKKARDEVKDDMMSAFQNMAGGLLGQQDK